MRGKLVNRQPFGYRNTATVALLVALGLAASAVEARAQSGQTAFGQATVEPAIDYATGNTIFLLTPNKAPLPSKANPRAVAPLYLPMYPVGSTINPDLLNCQPDNCDHANVLPFWNPLLSPWYPNGGATCTQYGLPAGGCALVIGHDHMVGVPPTGDFNVAWHVTLLVFTPKAFQDGAINVRLMTLQDIEQAMENGDVFPADTPITFNCSIVSSTVYYLGVPLSF